MFWKGLETIIALPSVGLQRSQRCHKGEFRQVSVSAQQWSLRFKSIFLTIFRHGQESVSLSYIPYQEFLNTGGESKTWGIVLKVIFPYQLHYQYNLLLPIIALPSVGLNVFFFSSYNSFQYMDKNQFLRHTYPTKSSSTLAATSKKR